MSETKLVSLEQYNKMVAAVVNHHRKTWVVDGEQKIAERRDKLLKCEMKALIAENAIEEVISGQLDSTYNRPSDKETALTRHIDNLNKYLYEVDKIKRELVMLEKNLT